LGNNAVYGIVFVTGVRMYLCGLYCIYSRGFVDST